MDLQGLAERLRLEDSCHGKHLKVLEIHRCCFLVLGCFHDAPGVLNNNYIHSMTDLLVLLVYGGAGHMAVRCWRSSNWANWKRSTKPCRTEKQSGKRWQIRWCVKRDISCYLYFSGGNHVVLSVWMYLDVFGASLGICPKMFIGTQYFKQVWTPWRSNMRAPWLCRF